MKLELCAYGKINLGLDVLRRLENGYHEVKMVMQTVELHDVLTFETMDEDEILLETNAAELPVNEDNLIYKACQMLKQAYGVRRGVRIYLDKKLPVAAGMAGGSADAAAALVGMNRLFELGLSVDKLMEYGVKLGADVPYCIMQGTALSEGIGEKLTPLSSMPDCVILLAKPPISVSTKMVYENLHANELTSHPDIDGMAAALERNDLQGVTDRMENVLETVTEVRYPVIADIKKCMLECGAGNALMSGSGPTVFGIFEERQQAEYAAEKIRCMEPEGQVIVTRPYNR